MSKSVGTFGDVELFELLLLLLLTGFHGQGRGHFVDLPEQRVLHEHGAQVPAGDEATADEVGAKGHDLTHQHGSEDVGQLVNNAHGGVHVCVSQENKVTSPYNRRKKPLIEYRSCVFVSSFSMNYQLIKTPWKSRKQHQGGNQNQGNTRASLP